MSSVCLNACVYNIAHVSYIAHVYITSLIIQCRCDSGVDLHIFFLGGILGWIEGPVMLEQSMSAFTTVKIERQVVEGQDHEQFEVQQWQDDEGQQWQWIEGHWQDDEGQQWQDDGGQADEWQHWQMNGR